MILYYATYNFICFHIYFTIMGMKEAQLSKVNAALFAILSHFPYDLAYMCIIKRFDLMSFRFYTINRNFKI